MFQIFLHPRYNVQRWGQLPEEKEVDNEKIKIKKTVINTERNNKERQDIYTKGETKLLYKRIQEVRMT